MAHSWRLQSRANGQNQDLNQTHDYDVRMTHARAKPRVGFSYDFTPDEGKESAAAEAKPPPVRTRTTIIIPDSPPSQPVDRKGKRRAVDEVLDLESGEWNSLVGSGSSTSALLTLHPRKKEEKVLEVIELLSDDEMDTDKEGELEKVQTVLVCTSCRRPLRMGGDRLWALRCGHMIDARCYRKLAERPIAPKDMPVLDAEFSVERMTARKRKRLTAMKSAAMPAPPVPHVAETIEWTCPVALCGRAHWSERVVMGGTSAWQPVKETGAVGVFV
ncbi:hypothetical protein FRC08_009452 [Ceratobasidium sp. 394]|nr:hypothetical protein FRC08_009452 [Ceratobasidium sp. 394]KAG9101271.1 hypothetical protein FS749_008495 [Ceratobasidium sp. UAMH 11750]